MFLQKCLLKLQLCLLLKNIFLLCCHEQKVRGTPFAGLKKKKKESQAVLIICLSQSIIFKQPVKHFAMWTRFRQIKSNTVRCMFVSTWILLVWIISSCCSHKGESYNHCCNHITRGMISKTRGCNNCLDWPVATALQILNCLYAGVFFFLFSLNLLLIITIIIIWWFYYWNKLLICFI